MPKRAWSSRRSFRICAWMVTSSAVVGSSAIRRSGSLASAIAIITRWRWPPESWWGYASRRRSASGSPTRCRSSTVRVRAARRPSPLWTKSTSLTCFSIVWSGLSDVIGSWKIMAIRLPRTRRSVASSAPRSSWPWNTMLPAGMPGRRVRQELEDRQRGHGLAGAALAHEPDGLPPRDVEGDAADRPHLAAGRVERHRQVADPERGAPPPSRGLPRVERVAHRLADEDEEAQHHGQDDEAGDAEPRRLEVRLALGQDLAERRRARAAGRSRGSRAR